MVTIRTVGALLLALLLPLLAVAAATAADVIELKSGVRIEGKLRQASPAGVIIEVGGRARTFARDDVQAIYFTDPVTRPTATPAGTAAGAPAADGLGSLEALRAAAAGGRPDGREYAVRANEIRAAVERYLASLPSAAVPGADALREAARYYQLADFAWRNRGVVSDKVWLKRDPALERCHGYRDFVDAMRAKGESHYSERTRSYLVISDGVLTVLWSCAADRLAEAEQALAGQGKP